MRRFANGFTLMELMVVLAIAGLVVGFVVPSFKTTLKNAQRRETATSFYSALTLARSEAIARNLPVRVCARTESITPGCADLGSTEWKYGWIIETTDATPTQLLIHDPINTDFTLNGVATPLRFDEGGRIAAGVVYKLCRGAGDTASRRISVSRSGRVSLHEAGSCAG